tara:strand:+ start:180 stop:533 length:354 start_codon:yes stop_codon:yes gene_type:complete
MDDERALLFAKMAAAVMELGFRNGPGFHKSELDVLATILDNTIGQGRFFAQIHRDDLCEATGYSAVSVSKALTRLQKSGVVIRFKTGGSGKTGHGRAPYTYKIDMRGVNRLLRKEAA